MATIRKRGESWQVQVRREGFPAVSKSFRSKVDANAWASEIERSIDRNEPSVSDPSMRSLTMGDLFTRYEREISVKKRGARYEVSRIGYLKTTFLSKVKVTHINSSHIAQYRNERLKTHSNGSVRRELTIIRHCFEIARREWGIALLTNPVKQIAIPKPNEPRHTRLKSGEHQLILETIGSMRVWYLRPLFILAVETGMRRGELLSLQWHNVNLELRTAKLDSTKNGSSRTVPLSPTAFSILSKLPRTDNRVLPISQNAVRLAWERLRTKAQLHHLRLHDLRHEAVSRFFELGLSIPEVALISGHRDTRMLMRYTHLRPEALADKLARLSGPEAV